MVLHTVSASGEYESCERRYFFKHVALVRPRIKGKALNVGSLLHSGIEPFAKGKSLHECLTLIGEKAREEEFFASEEGQIEYYRTGAMLKAYCERWASSRENWQVIAAEKEFKIELAPGIWFAGKRDLDARAEGRLYVWDHKSTSEEIGNVGTDFWQRLAIDKQIVAYSEAALREYGELPSILWDVIKKPGGKPKMKAHISRRKGETDEALETRKAEARETLDEFRDRLVAEMTSKSDERLVRREVHRTREQHAGLLEEIVETCRRIESHTGLWIRNDKGCRAFGSTCPYLGICAGVEGLDSERFEKLETANPELTTREVTNDELDNCPL